MQSVPILRNGEPYWGSPFSLRKSLISMSTCNINHTIVQKSSRRFSFITRNHYAFAARVHHVHCNVTSFQLCGSNEMLKRALFTSVYIQGDEVCNVFVLIALFPDSSPAFQQHNSWEESGNEATVQLNKVQLVDLLVLFYYLVSALQYSCDLTSIAGFHPSFGYLQYRKISFVCGENPANYKCPNKQLSRHHSTIYCIHS